MKREIADRIMQLDEDLGLIIGDLEREELKQLKGVVDAMLELDDKTLAAVNIVFLKLYNRKKQ